MQEEISFDRWNVEKKMLQTKSTVGISYPKQGEVWMSSVGKNLGFEQNGSGESFSRPVLVIKKFNNKMFWTVPLSSKQKNVDFYYNFTDPNNLDVSLILAQMKLMSAERFNRKMYDIQDPIFESVRIKLMEYLI